MTTPTPAGDPWAPGMPRCPRPDCPREWPVDTIRAQCVREHGPKQWRDQLPAEDEEVHP